MIPFIKSSQKKQILSELEEIYGISKLNYQLIQGGKKKVRAFSGSLTKEDLAKLSEEVNVELIGMYILSQKDREARLNFDAIPLLKNQITKNIFEITKEQFEQWIRGQDLEIQAQRGTLVLKHQDNLVGVGKSNGEKIFNYVPKERKIKTPLPKKI